MAPHIYDSAVSHPSSMSQTSKSVPAVPRIRPAIPLVFGRTKPSAHTQEHSQPHQRDEPGDAIVVKADTSVPTASEPAPSASPLPDAPLTPDSAQSTHAITGIVTPPDTLSDPNPESEDSKASTADTPASSYAPFSPSTGTMETPTMFSPQYTYPRHPPMHPQAVTASHNYPAGPNMAQYVAEGSTTHYGLTNGHHPRPRGGHAPRGSSSESIPTSHHPTSHNIPATTGSMPQPHHNVAKYGQAIGYTSPTPVTSPTAWNPAANFFVPPGMPITHVPVSNGHGLSRSDSHSSSGPDVPPMLAPISHPSQLYRPLPVDTVALGNYMISQFSNREFADFSLKILQSGNSRSLSGFPVHAVVIARSPTLQSLMRSQTMKQTEEADGLNALTIEVRSKFVRPASILDAIGYLYGLPLPAFEDLSFGAHLRHSATDSMAALNSALSLAGAGLTLKLPDVVSHALAYAATKLSWESLDKTLSFVHESLEALDAIIVRAEEDLKYSLSLPITTLFLHAERFLVENFPETFDFHASAPELSDSRRLPALQESRPSVSDPRLASIQFGAMPTEQSSHIELGNLLSSILLTVPTTLLQHLLNSPGLGLRVGYSNLSGIVREVVEERERRRSKIIKTRRVLPGATPQQWEETNWEERVEANSDAPSGYLITRLRRET